MTEPDPAVAAVAPYIAEWPELVGAPTISRAQFEKRKYFRRPFFLNCGPLANKFESAGILKSQLTAVTVCFLPVAAAAALTQARTDVSLESRRALHAQQQLCWQ